MAWVGNVPGARGVLEEHCPGGEASGSRREGLPCERSIRVERSLSEIWGPLWKDQGRVVGEAGSGPEGMGLRNKNLNLIQACEEDVCIWGSLA